MSHFSLTVFVLFPESHSGRRARTVVGKLQVRNVSAEITTSRLTGYIQTMTADFIILRDQIYCNDWYW